jgi:Asparagine synthase
MTSEAIPDLGADWVSGANPLGLTDLEVASGIVCNTDRAWPRPSTTAEDPLGALDDVLLPLLERPPLVVAFSGGRDSSALLAAATRAARRSGLRPPVAMTARWSDDPDSDETAWQETVIRALGVADWQIFDPSDELDLLGAFACDALQRHGLFWPAPAYAFIPFLRAARGGTLVSGEGGDELFGWWPLARLRALLSNRHRPTTSAIRDLLVQGAPYRARYLLALRSVRAYQDWLQPEALHRQRTALAAERAVQPCSWPGYVSQQAASRDLDLTVRTLKRFASAEGSGFVAPFLAARFVAALGRFGGRTGIGDRTAVMTAVFGELLPRETLTRVGKASFGRVFWGPASREFAREWSGSGLPAEMVRPPALRDAWLRDVPVYGSALPLHAAWLAAQASIRPPPRGY